MTTAAAPTVLLASLHTPGPDLGLVVRESLAAPVCSQGSRAASSWPFHLWLPEFMGHLLDLQCPQSKATPGAVLSGHAALARPVEDRWLREGWMREQEAEPRASLHLLCPHHICPGHVLLGQQV